MNFAIRLTPEAEETYQIISEQLRERWGEKFVIKLEAKISKTFELISHTPLIYPLAKENLETRKCVLHKNCSMYYRISGYFIDVVYFWDNRQDPMVSS